MTGFGYTFNGTGDPVSCSAILLALMYKQQSISPQCQPSPCAIGAVYQPLIPTTKTMYVVGDFYLSLGTLNLNGSPSSMYNLNLDTAYNGASSLCAMVSGNFILIV